MNPLVKEALMAPLKEAYESSDTSFFSDGNKGGVLGTLARLSGGELAGQERG